MATNPVFLGCLMLVLLAAGIGWVWFGPQPSLNPEQVADEYCEALNQGEPKRLSDFYAHAENGARISDLSIDLEGQLKLSPLELISITRTPWGTAAQIRIAPLDPEDKRYGEGSFTLYLDGTGRILYDPLCFIHPAMELFGAIIRLEDEDAESRRMAEGTLNRYGVPLYGVTHSESREARRVAVEKIVTWWQSTAVKGSLAGALVPLTRQDAEMAEIFRSRSVEGNP